jgi:signal transduction histidine kinase
MKERNFKSNCQLPDKNHNSSDAKIERIRRELATVKIYNNGNGIPSSIKKNLSAFLHHKAPGQGTGLGLSLSYDIVKAHGGKLTIDTIEDESSTFYIELPTGTGT